MSQEQYEMIEDSLKCIQNMSCANILIINLILESNIIECLYRLIGSRINVRIIIDLAKNNNL